MVWIFHILRSHGCVFTMEWFHYGLISPWTESPFGPQFFMTVFSIDWVLVKLIFCWGPHRQEFPIDLFLQGMSSPLPEFSMKLDLHGPEFSMTNFIQNLVLHDLISPWIHLSMDWYFYKEISPWAVFSMPWILHGLISSSTDFSIYWIPQALRFPWTEISMARLFHEMCTPQAELCRDSYLLVFSLPLPESPWTKYTRDWIPHV